MLKLLIATTNKGKITEFQHLLAESIIELKSLVDFKEIIEPVEDGDTFLANAKLKAKYYAKKTDCLAIADDSGIEVESLGNSPGIYSARYAGADASDTDNIQKLLEELEKSKDNHRNARFVCEMAISDQNGEIIYITRGICEGKISLKPFGNNGFGYDPVFIPNGYKRTFGELESKIKQQISHRSIAVKQIIKFLHTICTS